MSIIIPGLMPQGSRLLLKPSQERDRYFPRPASAFKAENPPSGVVLAFGPEVKLNVDDCGNTRSLKPGDRVIYELGTEINFYTNIRDASTRLVVIFASNVLLTLLPKDDLVV